MRVVAFVLLCGIWGSTWLAIKVNLQDFPPFLSAGGRFLVASLVLFLIQGMNDWQQFKAISWPKLKPALLFGVLNGINYGLIYWGEQFIPSSLTGILNGALPFFSLIFAVLLLKEQLNLFKIIGFIIGFSGLWLVFGRGVSLHQQKVVLYGEIAIILAAMVYSFASTIAKRNSTVLPPLMTTAWQMASSALTLFVLAGLFERRLPVNYSFSALAAFLYLGLVGSALAFYLYNYLLNSWDVTAVSYVSFITPIIATILGSLVLKEVFHWSLGFGLATVILGMYLLNRGAKITPQTALEGSVHGSKYHR